MYDPTKTAIFSDSRSHDEPTPVISRQCRANELSFATKLRKLYSLTLRSHAGREGWVQIARFISPRSCPCRDYGFAQLGSGMTSRG